MNTNEQRELMQDVTKRLLHELKPMMDFLKANNVGVTIFAFGLSEPGQPSQPSALAYISTALREDMIGSLKEFVALQEAGIATDRLGERVTS